MKRIVLFFAVNLIVLNGCFAIDALQLKQARVAAYQWIRDYDVNGQLNARRNARQKFLSLFESGDVIVVNEYLPMIYQKGPKIKVSELADLLLDKGSFYKMYCNIDSAYIAGEEMVGNSAIEYVVVLYKTVSFVDRNSYEDTCYAYPKKTFVESVTLSYDLLFQTIVATSIVSDNSVNKIHVLHNSAAKSLDSVNIYVSDSFIKNSQKSDNPFVSTSFKECAHDSQMLILSKKTMKGNFHFGGGIGASLFSGKASPKFYDLSEKAGLHYDVNLGFYAQFAMKGKNRYGMEFDAVFNQNKIGLSASYVDIYEDIDEDEYECSDEYSDPMPYKRHTEITNYKETSQRYSVEVPISFRYDRILNKKLTVFAKIGAAVYYDVISKTVANGDALYSGVYDWMGGIEIKDYPKYGFGNYTVSETTDKTCFNKLGVKVFAGFGLQAFLSKHWSLDLGLYYYNVVYNRFDSSNDYYLTKRNNDYKKGRKDVWTSAFSGFSKLNQSNLNFKIQLNYNF